MNLELVGALNELERERGISKEILLEAIEAAIVSAYKRSNENVENVRVEVSPTNGSIRVYNQKQVVEEVMDEDNEISLQAARGNDPNYDVGDVVEIDVTPSNFGRIAAQTAKQVVIQRIREAERTLIYNEFVEREGDVITGIIQRSEYRNVLVDLGKVEAILPPPEQIPREPYNHGNRLKVLISEVRQTNRGPQVIVSRAHPGLLKRLFELEVPEIHDGVIEIMAVSREPGARSKIAVKTNDFNVDPVGACVGPRGMRVQAIVEELRGEKIDIVEYSTDPARFIGNALSPSRVVNVFVNEDEMSARAVVPDHQLSLAIGREGQNARLAARLTGWKIDIKSESQMAELALLEAEKAAEQRQRLAEEQEEPAEPTPVAQDAVKTPMDVDEITDEPSVAASMADEDAAAEQQPVVAAEEAPMEAEATRGGELADLMMEMPADLFIEGEDAGEKVEPTPPKPRKGRAERKELQTLIEDDIIDEEEPLPTLFEDDEEEVADVPERRTFGTTADGESPMEAFLRRWGDAFGPSQTSEEPAESARKSQKDDDGDKDDKTVLRDLSQLAEALKAKEEDE